MYFKGSVKNFASSSNTIRIIFDLSDGTTDFISFPSALSANEEVSFSKVIGASGKKVIRMRSAWTDGKGAGINLSVTQLEFGSTSSDYEPYTSSTLSLPISTYFPTGMKSAGSVYDELTETKAITRVGEVDLGTLAWNYTTSYAHPVFYANLMGVNLNSDLICTKFEFAGNIYASAYQFAQGASDNSISANSSGNNQIYVRADSITTVNDFKAYVNGVFLIHGLATPTETSFTTVSLVTENVEIPLSNNDGVLLGKCTEQLSENPGFIDAKIKLSDADGECYSNKIQLHVERKPS